MSQTPRTSAPRSRRAGLGIGVAGIALISSAAACSLVLDFGDERELVSAAGAAGVAGMGGGAAGGTTSGGAAGSAGGGGSAGMGVGGSAATAGIHSGGSGAGDAGSDAGDAGYCAQDASPSPSDAGAALSFYLDVLDPPGNETPGGDCADDDPRLTPVLGGTGANCDFQDGFGNERIEIARMQSVACVGCLVPEPELWVEFFVHLRQQFGAPGVSLMQPIRGGASAENATLAGVVLDDTGRLGLRCGSSTQYATGSVLEGATLMLTLHYSYATHVARLWRRSASGGYAVGQLASPLLEVSCGCSEPADGWLIQGLSPSAGQVLVDEIRVAQTHALIDASY